MEDNYYLQQINIVNQKHSLLDSLVNEGILDEQFFKVQSLEDRRNHHYLDHLFKLFFSHAATTLTTLQEELKKTPINLDELEDCLRRLKSSCIKVGAKNVLEKVDKVINTCKREELETGWEIYINSANIAIEAVKSEVNILKVKLNPFFELKQKFDDIQASLGENFLKLTKDDEIMQAARKLKK